MSNHRRPLLNVEVLEDRALLSAADALVVPPSGSLAAQLSTFAEEDFFAFSLAQGGVLRAQVVADLAPRLTLLTTDERELVRSDGGVASAPRIEQFLPAGDYLLRVSALTADATGDYRLDTSFAPALPPALPMPVEGNVGIVRGGDLNRDGALDLVVQNVARRGLDPTGFTVFLGNGDGTFQPGRPFLTETTDTFNDLALADLDGDSTLDLVVCRSVLFDDDAIEIYRGDGDGSFTFLGAAFVPLVSQLAVRDLDANGTADLIAVDGFEVIAQVFLGNGDGTFQDMVAFPTGGFTSDFVLADFDDDGHLDLLSASQTDDNVTLLRGNGDGGFQRPCQLLSAGAAVFLAVNDFNRDGQLDFVLAADGGRGTIEVYQGNGNGAFRRVARFNGLGVFDALTTADVNSDTFPDILTTSDDAGTLLFLGRGDGSFLPPRLAIGSTAGVVALAGDFDANGTPDLAVANLQPGAVSILPGNGDGSFRVQSNFPTGSEPATTVSADIDNDGLPDLVSVNFSTDDISVLLGNGDGTFQTQKRFAVGNRPAGLVVGDVNRDRRPDLLVLNVGGAFAGSKPGNVSVLLGNGDGTFQPQRQLDVGAAPNFFVAGDFVGDEGIDLLVFNLGVGAETRLLEGQRDGSFNSSVLPNLAPNDALLVDVVGDRRLDLVQLSSHFDSPETGSLFGHVVTARDGVFGDPRFLCQFSEFAVPLRAADVNGDGRLDLLGTFFAGGAVALAQADGTFAPPLEFALDAVTTDVATGDFDRDGVTDLVFSSRDANDLIVLLRNPDHSFRATRRFPVGIRPIALAVDDLNADGVLDLIVTNEDSSDVTVLLGNGDGTFLTSLSSATPGQRNLPFRADLDGDGVADTVVLTNSGAALFRRGLPDADNRFAPPTILNPGRPGRSLQVLITPQGNAVALSDLQGDTVSVYRLSGGVEERVSYFAGVFPQGLATADLNADGWDDLIVLSTRAGSATFLVQDGLGRFGPSFTRTTGVAPVDVVAVDVDGRFGVDVLIANRSSGDVRVLFNDADHAFLHSARYRVGVARAGTQSFRDQLEPLLTDEPFSLVAGLFDGDSQLDLVLVARGGHEVRTLLGSSGSGFLDVAPEFSISTGLGFTINDRPGELAAADFNRDGRLDVAVVMEDRGEVWLYLGNGDGTFSLGEMVPAGNTPTGLSLEQLNDDNGDGFIDAADAVDLLIGNGFGDILFVLGNGDGTFRPFVRTDQRVPFVATDLNGDGRLDVVLADQARDVARSRLRSGASFTPGAFRRDGRNGLIGPGDVALADLDGRFGSDLIFANTGSNNVLVYLRRADGSFARNPRTFFAGTNPVDLRVAQFTDDNGDEEIDGRDVPDLAVANEGSNDVSILLGSRAATGAWTFRLGPRLSVAGFGPRFIGTRDVNRDGTLDIVATSGSGGQATLLRGVGDGFFNDVAPPRLNLGADVLDVQGNFALLANGDVVRFDLLRGAVGTVFTSTRGGTALDVMALPGLRFPLLFVGNGDGTVSGLMSADGLTYTETATRADLSLDNPSALQVLQAGNGRVEVYVSDAGENGLVVLRFGVEELTAGLTPLDGSAPLALVAALTSTTVPNSLLIDVLLDEAPTAVEVGELFAAEEFTGTLSAVGGRIESVGEQVLSALSQAEGALPGLVAEATEPPQGLRELILGVEEGLKRFAQPQPPQTPPPEPDPDNKPPLPGALPAPEILENLENATALFPRPHCVGIAAADRLTPLLTAAVFAAGAQSLWPRRWARPAARLRRVLSGR